MARANGGAGASTTVSVDGLAELRKALLKSGIATKSEVRDVMRAGADAIVPTAKANVTHKASTLARAGYSPGKFASRIRATTSGEKGVIRVPIGAVPYARIVEFGGTFGGGASRTKKNLADPSTRVRSVVGRAEAQSPIRKAIVSETPEAARALEQALADLFRRHELLAD